MTDVETMKRFTVLALAGARTSCAVSPPTVGQEYFAAAVPFCRMMAEKDQYLDREILVSGIYISTPHGGQLFGDCDTSAIELRGSLNLPDDRAAWRVISRASKQVRGARIPIVLKGVLKAWSGPGITTSSPYWLERVQMLAADGKNVRRPPV